jgi:hypothetical protein
MLDSNADFAVDGRSMDEIKFRESRVCRLLGNPVIYQLVLFLCRRLGQIQHRRKAGSLLA